MADLVGGRYPQSNPHDVLLGATRNSVNASVPARSNMEFFGLGNPSDGALAATGVAVFVPVPVSAGSVISTVSLFIGATAADTPTHQFAAIYSGIAVPAKLAQSTDTTTAAIPASAKASWNLSSPYQVTAADAPYGFIYAGLSVTATAVPTALSMAIPTAVGYQWTANGPLFLSATAGAALLGTAAATIAAPAAKAVAPVVVLT